MATVRKISLYLVDPNGFYEDGNTIMEDILNDSGYDMYAQGLKEEVRCFEWDDDCPLNSCDLCREEADSIWESIIEEQV